MKLAKVAFALCLPLPLLALQVALEDGPLAAHSAWAQSTDDEGDEMTFEEGGLFGEDGDSGGADASTMDGSLEGTEENPDAPVLGSDAAAATTRKAAVVATGYPIEKVKRPITLPRRMTEVTLGLPNSFNSYFQSFVLGAQHGITREFQAGLRYGAGTFAAVDGESEFFGGKAFAIDARYQIFKWLAAQVSLPILVDPFSMAVTVGAPMQITLFDKVRFHGGMDLLSFRIHRFIPSVENAAMNHGLAALDEAGTDMVAASMNVQGGVIYQLKPNLALDARVGLTTDFDSTNDSTSRNPILFDGGVLYSSSNKLDIGGRIGFSDLNEAGQSFGLYVTAALRL